MTPFELLRTLLEAVIAGQMGFFAIFLFSTGDRRPVRLALACLAAIFATISVINAVTSTGMAIWLRPINLVLELLMGPAIYLFVQQIRDQPPALTWRSIGHLFPLVAGPLLFIYRNVLPVDAIAIAIHTGYLVAIGATVIGQQRHYQQDGLFRFASLISAFFLVLVLFRASISVEAAMGRDFRMSGSYIGLLTVMLALSATILVTALRNPQILAVSRAFTKYAGSNASAEEIDLILKRLDNLLREEKLFRDPDLNLADLAARVRAPEKHVSQAVNQRRGMSVPALINSMRVEFVATELIDVSRCDLSITETMLKAGFGSKSAFQREFRKEYGMSPSEYRSRYGTSSHWGHK